MGEHWIIDLEAERLASTKQLFRDAHRRSIDTIERRHVRDRDRFASSAIVELRDGEAKRFLKGGHL